VGTQARTRARGVAGMEVAAWNRRTGVGAAGERKGRDLKGMNASSSFGRADGGGGRGRLCVSILRELPTRKVNRGLSRRGGPGMMLRSVGKRARGRRGFFWLLHSNRSLARSSAKKNERKWSTKSPWIRTPRRPLPLPRPPSTAWTRCHRTGSWRRRTRYQRRRREEKRSPMRARSPPPLSFSRSLSPHPSVAAFRLPPGNRPGVQGGPAGRDRGGVHGSR